MATVNWKNAASGNWNNAANWDTGSTPGASDNAVISVAGSYTVALNTPISVGSITIGDSAAALQIQDAGGTEAVNGSVANSGYLGLDAGGAGGSTMTVGGSLTNTNTLQVGNGGMTAASLLTIGGGLTTSNATLSVVGGQTGASASIVAGGAPTGTLTGTFALTGNAGGAIVQYASGGITQIGDGASNGGELYIDGANADVETGATNSNSALATLGTLASNGLVDLRNGAIVTTATGLTVNGGSARLKIDAYGGAGGGNVTIGGNLTNSSLGSFSDGGVSVGASGMTASDLLTVDGGYIGTGGQLDIIGGQKGASAGVVVTGAASSTLTGNIAIVGDAGGASIQFGSGGISQIGDGGGNGSYLYIDGANAFAEVGATSSNSALTGLALIAGNGVLDLRDGVTLTTTGSLSVTGGSARLKVDAYGGSGGGTVTIGGNLTNSSFGSFSDGGVSVGTGNMTVADLLTVDGSYIGTGGLLNVIGGQGGASATVQVLGAAQATRTGNISVVGDVGGATLQYGGGGFTQIGDGGNNGGYLYIDGANAFVQTGLAATNSALNNLSTIAGNGVLDLRDGDFVATNTSLTVNGGGGRLKIDAYGGIGGGNVTIGGNLSNSSFGNFSDGGVSLGNGAMTVGDLLTVQGSYIGTGGLLTLTGGKSGAGALMDVIGAAQSLLTGNISLTGDAGGAAMEFASGGITQIGDGASNGAYLYIDNSNAFVETGATNSNSALSSLGTIAGNGALDLRDGVTVTTTTGLTVNGGDGRLKVDAYGGAGGSTVTIGGNLTNSSFGNFSDGGVSVGNSAMSNADTLIVQGNYIGTGGLLEVAGGSTATATALMNVTGTLQSTLTGNIYLGGDTGGAILQYASGGITQIGDGASNGGDLEIDGANAFDEVGATNSNSALSGLTSIAGNGVLDLRDGASVTTTAGLTVNGGDGRLKVDAYGGNGGGTVTIGGNLTNTSFGNFSDGGVSVGNSSMGAGDLLTVDGTYTGTGGLLVLTGGKSGAAAQMAVTGAVQSTLTGNIAIIGGAGGASLRYGGGGITQIGDGASNGGDQEIDGANAFDEVGATNSNSALTGLTTIASNGLLDLRDGASVITTSSLTVNGGLGRLKVDSYGGNGGSTVTIGGDLTNTSTGSFGDGGVEVGNTGMTVSDLLTVDGALNNSGQVTLLGGQAGATARLVVSGAVQSTLTGSYAIVSGAGGASLQYGSGGITQLGDGAGNGADLYLDGATAFAEVGATNSNSALTDLGTIDSNGLLDLRDGVLLTTATGLTVNGGDARLKVDAYGGSGGGNVTIGGELTNTAFGNFNDGGVSVGNTGMTVSDLLTVDGQLQNSGLINILGNNGTTAAEAVVSVDGIVQNSGALNIGTRGELSVTNGNVFVQTAGTTDLSGTLNASGVALQAGLLDVSGGMVTGGSLAISAGATLFGFGTIAPAISGIGAIQASGGTLDLAGGLASSAAVAIENASALDIAGPDAGTVTFAGASGVLVLEQPMNFTGTIDGLQVSDTLLLRGVQATGATTTYNSGDNTSTLAIALAAGGTLDLTLAGNEAGDAFSVNRVGSDSQIGAIGAAVGVINTATPIVLPAARTSTAETIPLSISNGALAGSAPLDVNVGTTSGDAVASGTIVSLAAGATDTTDILVGLGAFNGGSESGTVTLDFASALSGGLTAPLPSETFGISGTVYREAVASIAPIALFAHVGDPGVETLDVSNVAPADGFSEALIASLTGATGGFAVASAGPTSDIAAGGSNATTLRLSYSTAQTGFVSGDALVALTSDGGTGAGSIDGLGTIALAPEAVPVTINIDNYATAAIEPPTGVGTLTQVSNAATLDLGTVAENTGPFGLNFGVANTASGPADVLSGSFVATASSGFTLTSLGAFSGIAAGQTAAAGVTLDTTVGGVVTQTITLDPTGGNAGGYSAPLTPETLTITGTVEPLPSPIITAGSSVTAMTDVPMLLGLAIADPNTDTLPLTVTITDTSGVLTAAQSGNATVSGGGSNKLVLTGDIADLNEELAAVAYSAAVVGSDTVNVSVVDQHHASATQSIAVGVAPVPLTGPVFNGPTSELGLVGTATGFGGLSVSDPYGEATDTTETLALVDPNGGTLSITGNYGGTIIGQGTPTLEIIGTVPEINAYLGDGLLDDLSASLLAIDTGFIAGFIRHGSITAVTENDLVTLGGGPEGKFFELGVESAAFALNSLIGLIPGNTPPNRADFIKALVDIIGDPHIVAANGAVYDFNAEGEYVLATSTSPGDSFDVQVRLQSFNDSPYASVVTQVAAQVGTDRVTFGTGRADPIWVDGTAAALSSGGSITLSGGIVTQTSANGYQISWDTGEVLNVTDEGDLLDTSIAPGPNNSVGSLVGLATLADTPADEFQLVDGSVLTSPLTSAELYGAYASAWAVPQADSLFDYGQGQSTATFDNPSFPAAVVTLADLPAAVVAQAASIVAAAGITDPGAAAAIEFDYILSGGDPSIVSSDASYLAGVSTTPETATPSGPAPVAIGVMAVQPEVEGSHNTASTAVFTAYLTAPSTTEETINYAVVATAMNELGASAFGGTLPTGQITIAAGQISGQFTITVPPGGLGLNPDSLLAVQVSATDGTPLFAPDAQTTIVQAIPGPPAVPVISDITNLGSFYGSGTSYTLDLGDVQYGEPLPAITFAIENTQTPPSDFLGGTLTVAPVEGFTVAGTTLPSPLGGGASYQDLTVSVNSVKFGANSETITFDPTDSNVTGFSENLAPVTLTINDTIVPPTMVFSQAYGDVHIITYSGLLYNFQGEGEFTLAQSRVPGDTFDIQLRLVPWTTASSVTVISQVAVSVGTDKVTFDQTRPDTVYVDGNPSTISAADPTVALNGGELTQISSNVWRVNWNTGEEATITGWGNFFNVTDGIPLSEPNMVGGLQGEDAGPSNDFQLSSGTVIPQPITAGELYGPYADSWRVTPTTSLFDYLPGQTTATFTDKDFPFDAVSLSNLPSNLIAAASTLVAADGITDPGIAQSAELDYIATGDPIFINAAQQVAEQVTSTTPVSVQAPVVAAVGVEAIPAGYTEVASGVTPVNFDAYLTAPSSSAIVVNYTAVAAGAGFFGASAFAGDALPSGSVTIAAGSTIVPFTLDLAQGALGTTPSEKLEVQISAPGGSPVFAQSATATVANNVAQSGVAPIPQLLKLGNVGTLTEVSPTAYTLSLGTLTQGETAGQIQLGIANDAAPPADQLSGTFGAPSGTGFLISDDSLPSAIAAGGQYDGLEVATLTASAGTNTETLTFKPSDVNESGYVAALSPITLTVTDTVAAPGVGQLNTPQTIVFPNVHVGAPETRPLSVSDTGSAPIAVSVSATAPVTASGSIAALAPGVTDSTDLSVSVDTSSGGLKNSAVDVNFGTTDPVVDVFGGVYRLASGTVAPITKYVHVGDPGTIALDVSNGATADGFSENLLASLAAVTPGITIAAGGPTGEIAPGASDTSSLQLGFSTAGAASIAATATVDVTSDGGTGTGSIDGLGTTVLTPIIVPVAITVESYANPVFEDLSANGTFSGGGTVYTLNLGTIQQNSAPFTVNLGVLNSVVGPSDAVSGTLSAVGSSAFINSGLAAIGTLGAGQSDVSPSITLNTGTTGTFSETITLAGTDSNAGGYSSVSPAETLTVTGSVSATSGTITVPGTSPAVATILGANPVALGAVHFGATASETLDIGNTATAGAANLDGSAQSETGAATASGSFSGVAPGGSGTGITVGLNTGTVGVRSGTVVLGFTSDAGTAGTTPLASQTVTVTGTAYREAAATLLPLTEIVHVGDAGSVTLPVTNSDPADGYSENLIAALIGVTGNIGIASADPTADIAAGQTNANNLALAFSTASAGTISGTATVGLTSDGGTGADSIDGLGTTTLTSQTDAVNITVNNYADPVFTGNGDLTSTGADSYTLNLGTAAVGSSALAATLTLGNDATGPADWLNGTYSVSGGTGFSNLGLAAFSTLTAGSSLTADAISLSTATAGVYTETIVLTPTDTNSGGYSSILAAQTIMVTGTIAAPTGSGTGDVHMVTYDGLRYDFQAVGDYVLTRSTVPGDSFQVQIDTVAAPAVNAVSITEEAATQVGADVVTFGVGQSGIVWVDGAPDVALSAANPVQQLSGGQLTEVSPDEFRLTWNSGESLDVTDAGLYLNDSVTLPESDGPGSVQGLLGGDSGQANDFQLADGTVLQKPGVSQVLGEFANDWQVTPATSLLGNTPMQFIYSDGGQSVLQATAAGQVLNAGAANVLSDAGALGATFLGSLAALTNSAITGFSVKDVIDVTDLNPATASVSFNGGVLQVGDGTHGGAIQLSGNVTGTFHVIADGHGGALIGLA